LLWYFLVPEIKNLLEKEPILKSPENIQGNVTMLKAFSKNNYQQCFQAGQTRRNACIKPDGG
jgi:hypothetical protein